MKHNVSSATIDLMVAQGYTHVRTLHLSVEIFFLFPSGKVENILKYPLSNFLWHDFLNFRNGA